MKVKSDFAGRISIRSSKGNPPIVLGAGCMYEFKHDLEIEDYRESLNAMLISGYVKVMNNDKKIPEHKLVPSSNSKKETVAHNEAKLNTTDKVDLKDDELSKVMKALKIHPGKGWAAIKRENPQSHEEAVTIIHSLLG